MLWTLFFVFVSFFAIIGLMEFVACIVEMISTRSTKSLREIRVVADVEGYEPHVEFVLGSLRIMVERIAFKNVTTKIFIRNLGTEETTYQRIKEYVEENSDVYLIEKEEQI